ncbi:MAG TPA: cyclic-di-AMP receptor, partial [Candidatus Dormibacteraeota bacterium]|nr:cyclic-di-AMP receptor [Candidatus Dormibacteraeota bacterium]
MIRPAAGAPWHTRHVKLVVAVVQDDDADTLVEALLRKEFRATKLPSSGGFLKASNATVMLG